MHTALVMGLLAPAPAFASWWIVRSSDEKCLVVDVEPRPGDKGVTKLGKGSYRTKQEAEADLGHLCPEGRSGR
jgi:hypothetical protein